MIEEETPEQVNHMLYYLYHNSYLLQKPTMDEPDWFGVESVQPLSRHVGLYALGDRLLIPGLKASAQRKFKRDLARNVHKSIKIQIATSSIVSNIYNSTPSSDRGLRDAICHYLVSDIKELLPCKQFQNVLTKTRNFATDLLNVSITRSFDASEPDSSVAIPKLWENFL